jgi:hypothetical protein
MKKKYEILFSQNRYHQVAFQKQNDIIDQLQIENA